MAVTISITITPSTEEDRQGLDLAAESFGWRSELYPEVIGDDGRPREGEPIPNPVDAATWLSRIFVQNGLETIRDAAMERILVLRQIESDRAARAAEREEETP